MTHQLQIPLGGLPVHLILVGNGTVAFVKVAAFKTVFDQSEEGETRAVFDEASFQLGNTDELCYNVAYSYKEIPDMLNWLKAQNLQEPVVIF